MINLDILRVNTKESQNSKENTSSFSNNDTFAVTFLERPSGQMCFSISLISLQQKEEIIACQVFF